MNKVGNILAVLMAAVCGFHADARTAGCIYKLLAEEGYSVKYSVVRENSAYCIIVIVKSDRLKFINEPTMLLKTLGGEVLKLKGKLIDYSTEPAGMVSGNVVIPVTEIS